jgi:hypothetical protein
MGISNPLLNEIKELIMKTGSNFFKVVAAGAAIAASLVFTTAVQASEGNVQKGILKCDVAGGVGMLLGSKKKMTCVFTKKNGDVEKYDGRVLKIGVDIGITKESHITWAVLAPSGSNEVGALSGNYTGVSGEVTVAGGVGGNVLVSAGKQFTLQPISVQTQTGLNIAGGIGSINLEYVK